jgi:hypothetical protein
MRPLFRRLFVESSRAACSVLDGEIEAARKFSVVKLGHLTPDPRLISSCDLY